MKCLGYSFDVKSKRSAWQTIKRLCSRILIKICSNMLNTKILEFNKRIKIIYNKYENEIISHVFLIQHTNKT